MNVALTAIMVALASTPAPLPLPLTSMAEGPPLRRYSEARFDKYLFHVYDIALWVSGERYSPAAVHALDIRYAIAVSGRDLAKRSVAEMRRQGITDAAKLARWEAEMTRVFPDIARGDRLVGVAIPGREARFYDATRALGAIDDGEFAAAFFAIWLGERTSEPALRSTLLRAP